MRGARYGLGNSGTDQRTLDAGCRGVRRGSRRGSPSDRTAPPAVAGSPCRHQPEGAPRLFADRDRGRRARRRFRCCSASSASRSISAMWCRSPASTGNMSRPIFGMTATAVVCFQAADIYEVQVFRGQLRQMTRMISSWAFVFLLFIGASFFAKLGGEISRLWLSAFFFVGLAALIAERLFLRAMVRGWARQGRLDRRTIIVGSDQNGEQLVEALKAPGRFRHRHPRRVRRPQRRPRARDLRRQRRSSARSTTSSNSPAAPASTSCCSRCRSRRRRGSSKC